ncbi:pyridoxal 5'-phosphate synthase glutaminase subunit PdxT [uncultured Corynebacterium sp.]|uniref:pyridoxal 5'-phosphate synthase glutaminase subunit PdxT n=1 Tax=uncultured Corynebacterium sp. TaxID=159447 RepID=UPI0025D6EF8B|nr:pyridoxal 5'-phosphate synthase glutaminase subunit PdxT [uncultured Corynebacterium sp.]
MNSSNEERTPLIGILAVQGGVVEHQRTLERLGVPSRLVRRPAHLEGVDGLILPGGESTTMSKLLELGGLLKPLTAKIYDGTPTFGTCAGMILLASEVKGTRLDAHCLSALDITVRRNAFGRQVDSFETDLSFKGISQPVHAVFIRAPWVESVGSDTEVLARVPADDGKGAIVAVRSGHGRGHVLATSFHPEVTDDDRVHDYFVSMVKESMAEPN